MTVLLCKELGVPNVIAKCSNEMHFKILTKVGADKVVFPEKESGTRQAKNLLSSGFMDVIELSTEVSMIELDVKKDWIGKTLLELNLRKKYSINVIAVKSDNKIEIDIDPKVPLTDKMKLVVIGKTSKLSKIK
jgi:trk system potassium uptake protein TrkA